jgi:hypothetical protein
MAVYPAVHLINRNAADCGQTWQRGSYFINIPSISSDLIENLIFFCPLVARERQLAVLQKSATADVYKMHTT